MIRKASIRTHWLFTFVGGLVILTARKWLNPWLLEEEGPFRLLVADPWALVAEHSYEEPVIAICAVVRNEEKDLDEWIAFHWLQGVRKFVLYDDGSVDDTVQKLQKYVKRGMVDLRMMNQSVNNPLREEFFEGKKMAHVNTCLLEMWAVRDVQGIDWVYLPDVDEYAHAMGPANTTLAQALHVHYGDDPCVVINRRDFGTCGHFRRPKTGLVIENYMLSARGYSHGPKLFINLRPKNESNKVTYVFGPHKVSKESTNPMCAHDNESQHLQSNHYLRSLEDYDVKLRNVSIPAATTFKDPLKNFWDRNRHEVVDDSARQRFAHQVRALMAYMGEGRLEYVPSLQVLSLRAPALMASEVPRTGHPPAQQAPALTLTGPSDQLIIQLLGPPDPAQHPLITAGAKINDCQVRSN